MNAKTKDLLIISLASLILGGGGLFAKLILLPADSIILGRTIIASAALLIFHLIRRESIKVKNRKDFGILVGLGVLMGAHWVAFYSAVQVSTVAIGVISIFTYPMFTALLEPLILKTKFNKTDLLYAIIIIIGVLTVVPAIDVTNNLTLGVALGLTSAIILSIRNIYSKSLLGRYSAPKILLYQAVTTAILLVPISLSPLLEASNLDWAYLLLSGVIFTALAHTLYVTSMTHLTATTVSIVASIQPLYATGLAFLILGEIPRSNTVYGGIIIVGAVVSEAIRKARN